MRSFPERFLQPAILWFFTIFAFSLAVSIALAQITLGASLAAFLVLRIMSGRESSARCLRPVYIAIAIFVGWMILTTLYSDFSLPSLLMLREEWLFTAIPLGVFIFRKERSGKQLLFALSVGILLASLYGFSQHIIGYDIVNNRELSQLDSQTKRLSGFFSHPLTFGNVIVVSSIFLTGYLFAAFPKLSKWERYFFGTSAFLGIAACALSNSRGPLLALGIGLISVGFLFKRIKIVIAVLLVVLALGATVSPTMIERFKERFRIDTSLRFEGGRFFVWYHSWLVIKDNPIMGVGQGNFREAYTKNLREDIGEHRKYTHAHNDILTFAAISGIPGATIYIILWSLILPRLWRSCRDPGLSAHNRGLAAGALVGSIVFLVCSITEATFSDEEVRQLLMFIWAAGLSTLYNECNGDSLRLSSR